MHLPNPNRLHCGPNPFPQTYICNMTKLHQGCFYFIFGVSAGLWVDQFLSKHWPIESRDHCASPWSRRRALQRHGGHRSRLEPIALGWRPLLSLDSRNVVSLLVFAMSDLGEFMNLQSLLHAGAFRWLVPGTRAHPPGQKGDENARNGQRTLRNIWPDKRH